MEVLGLGIESQAAAVTCAAAVVTSNPLTHCTGPGIETVTSQWTEPLQLDF